MTNKRDRGLMQSSFTELGVIDMRRDNVIIFTTASGKWGKVS